MKNHLGENIQITYSGWRAAIKKKFATVNIDDSLIWEGDKDICSAFLKCKSGKLYDLGQWDGAEGFVTDKTI